MSMASAKPRAKGGGLGETVKIVIQALILALLVRTFLFQPFNIPSGSMKDTLLVGDYLFVSKYAYGYSRFSLPFGFHLFDGRIFGSLPKRGDIVVFKLPRDESTDYIKRVIGLPGDKIQMINAVLYINGKAVPRVPDGFYVTKDAFGAETKVARYRETLPNGVSYDTLALDPNGFEDNTPVYEVPPDHLFMMGDNRDNSTDSRVLSAVGYVPVENLVGRAEILFFSVDEDAAAWEFWKWPWTVRWDRLFKLL
jgi:signal peptidase I